MANQNRFLYRLQLKSYLSIAAKPLETLALRFKQSLCQTGFNLESVLESAREARATQKLY